MKNYFIIHGSFGSSQENWFPWLESELEKKCAWGGGKVFNLDFPTGEDKQNYKNWEMVLNSVKRFINEESVFFCHSISCIFLVKYLIKNNLKIGKAIFVSGFNNCLGLGDEFDYVNCTMYTNRLNEFEHHAKERVCYYSTNDPYVRLDKLKEFASLIKAKEICDSSSGHYNTAAGYTKFEDLLKY